MEVHTGFSGELTRTCTTQITKIYEVFVKWKTQFLLYGEYCSNLPRAQEHIEELTKKSEVIKTNIEVSMVDRTAIWILGEQNIRASKVAII